MQCLKLRDERKDAVEAAAKRRELADVDVEHEGQYLIEAWDRHFATLKQLRLSADARLAALTAVTDWFAATGMVLTLTVAAGLSTVPSFTLNVKLSGPFAFVGV